MQVYSVTQINTYIKNLFVRDFVLSRITVRGEVSNCKYHSSGHIYFTLKDRGGAISCVMFSGQRERLTFRLEDGQEIDVSGQITVYEKSGTYQLYVRDCRLSGAGELYERFLQLKTELAEMGMFDEIYKKPIPRYSRRIGIVTASTGAAVRDIINVATRRDPYVELVLYPARVQGEGAKESIVRGIRQLDKMGLDVMIVGRGGGSIEDLWAFNEECVARAIFEAETPIISAVGHETDFTIADFVADRRAPTPSAAAELASFEYDVLEEQFGAYRSALEKEMTQRLQLLKARVNADKERLQRLSPRSVLQNRRQQLDAMKGSMRQLIERKTERYLQKAERTADALRQRMRGVLEDRRHRLQVTAVRLDGLSPLKKMGGGYGYITDDRGKSIRSVQDVRKGARMMTYVRDGRIVSDVVAAEEWSYGSG
ncbi:MAG: exodeoxyribonuclease VII large subunit [Lachnospiraceae bacterium]|nr:exodeoxyribonuclease VII large subunit [Lachnospiraceae bacterium]